MLPGSGLTSPCTKGQFSLETQHGGKKDRVIQGLLRMQDSRLKVLLAADGPWVSPDLWAPLSVWTSWWHTPAPDCLITSPFATLCWESEEQSLFPQRVFAYFHGQFLSVISWPSHGFCMLPWTAPREWLLWGPFSGCQINGNERTQPECPVHSTPNKLGGHGSSGSGFVSVRAQVELTVRCFLPSTCSSGMLYGGSHFSFWNVTSCKLDDTKYCAPAFLLPLSCQKDIHWFC